MRIGERAANVERPYNVRLGLTRRDDTLPDRILEDFMPDGFVKGQVANLGTMLDECSAFRGWEPATGLPTKGKLVGLGLEDIANELENLRKSLVGQRAPSQVDEMACRKGFLLDGAQKSLPQEQAPFPVIEALLEIESACPCPCCGPLRKVLS